MGLYFFYHFNGDIDWGDISSFTWQKYLSMTGARPVTLADITYVSIILYNVILCFNKIVGVNAFITLPQDKGHDYICFEAYYSLYIASKSLYI